MPLVLPDPSGPSAPPISLADLTGDMAVLGAWLREHRKLWEGMDDKAAAAVLLGGVSFEVTKALLALGTEAPWPEASEVRLDLTWTTWVEGTARVPVLNCRVTIPLTVESGGRDPARAVADLHAPLVAALGKASGLSSRALWRLVTDAVAEACLESGRHHGDAGQGMALAREILGDRASPLFNRQWGFFEIEARRPDGRSVREWFRARGGCCRYYTTAGGAYCSTCVLRDPGSRDAILRDWLATCAEAA
jgi:hypothetical protein